MSEFFIPLSYSASPLPVFRFEFRGEVKLESWGYSVVKVARC